MQQRGQGVVRVSEKVSEQGADLCTTFSKQMLERQKGWQQAGDKPLSEIEQVAVHKAHLLSQWATCKVKWHCKIEKQSANYHNTLIAGGWLMNHWPCPREREWGKETSPQ
jgi:hypothetical protein